MREPVPVGERRLGDRDLDVPTPALDPGDGGAIAHEEVLTLRVATNEAVEEERRVAWTRRTRGSAQLELDARGSRIARDRPAPEELHRRGDEPGLALDRQDEPVHVEPHVTFLRERERRLAPDATGRGAAATRSPPLPGSASPCTAAPGRTPSSPPTGAAPALGKEVPPGPEALDAVNERWSVGSGASRRARDARKARSPHPTSATASQLVLPAPTSALQSARWRRRKSPSPWWWSNT